MTTLQTILVTAIIAICLCFSIVLLVTSIQSALYDREREKREKEQATRNLEYHEQRMKEFKKITGKDGRDFFAVLFPLRTIDYENTQY
ncbi:MAG: hypothetical protein RSB11_07965 [Oscillospiraceae bacterium]